MRVSSTKRCCINCCGEKSLIDYKYLGKNWPVIKDAPDPTLILWANLGYTSLNKWIRSAIINIFCFIIVIASFYLIVYVMR